MFIFERTTYNDVERLHCSSYARAAYFLSCILLCAAIANFLSSFPLLIQSLGVGQLHWAPPLGWQEEAYWTGLAELKAAGRIREVGLSNYGPKGVTRAHRYLANLDTQLASNQVCRVLTYWSASVCSALKDIDPQFAVFNDIRPVLARSLCGVCGTKCCLHYCDLLPKSTQDKDSYHPPTCSCSLRYFLFHVSLPPPPLLAPSSRSTRLKIIQH